MSGKGRLAVGGLLLVFFFGLGLGPPLSPLLYMLTPLRRQYLSTYIAGLWHENDRAAKKEIRWILKYIPERLEPKSKHAAGSKQNSSSIWLSPAGRIW